MLISVIIPTRNRFDYISLLIGDLLKQNISGLEIIVVDQSDEPKPISNCQHIITPTKGPCISRNLGARTAKGDVLVFLDDDARIMPNFIEELTKPIRDGHFDAVAGAVCSPDGQYIKNTVEFLRGSSENFIKVLTDNPDAEKSRITLSFPAGCAAISKNVFEKVGGFNEAFDPTGAGEDREMAIKLYTYGIGIWYNSQAKLLHNNAPDGGSRDVGSRSLMLDVHSYKICKAYFSDVLTLALKRTLLNKYQRNFYHAIIRFGKIRTKYRILQEVKRLLD